MRSLARISGSFVFCIAIVGAPWLRAAPSRPPNIVLIMADDMGYECLGSNGSTSYRTPELDRMAATGMRFTNCHSQPLCTPSRVQLMTGRYNHRNYIRFGVLDSKEKTFGHLLKSAGYATCIVGKWQLGDDLRQPHDAGFDEYCLWHFDTSQGAGRGSRYWNPKIFVNGKRLEGAQGKFGPDVFCDQVLGFARRNVDKPFFVYYPMALPHAPLVKTPLNIDEEPPSGTEAQKAFLFGGMVRYVDTLVGRILGGLHEMGLSERTLVIFTGDNGTARGIRSRMGEHIVLGGKGLTTDNGTHVPLIASWQGTVPAGSVCEDLVDFSDMLPTLSDVVQAELPAEPVWDGRSFLPQLRGQTGNPREFVFCYYAPRHGNNQTVTRFARDKRWKLYGENALFDVVVDPQELHPIDAESLDADGRASRTRLQAALEQMEDKPQAR